MVLHSWRRCNQRTSHTRDLSVAYRGRIAGHREHRSLRANVRALVANWRLGDRTRRHPQMRTGNVFDDLRVRYMADGLGQRISAHFGIQRLKRRVRTGNSRPTMSDKNVFR